MKRGLIVTVALLGFALPANALDIQAITSKPTADNPQYQNKDAWPMLVGDEYFLKQKWEEGRTYIWDVPRSIEVAKQSRRRGPDATDPSNWIDAATGKPATELPDMDTDLILPDSETPYKAAIGDEDTKGAFCRHVTIGRGATFSSWGARHHRLRLFGNLWIRPGGSMRTGQGNLAFSGDRHTFLRYDWPEDGVLKKLHDERAVSPYKVNGEIIASPWMANCIGTYMVHDKAEGASTEVLGFVRLADEVGIVSGTFIIGRDSRFVSTGPASVSVKKGARVVLMDGAQCSHGQNQFVNRDWGVQAGAEVTGGTPDRPLKRDAYMGLGYRNWRNLPVPQPENETKPIPTTADGTKIYYAYGGYNAMVQGNLIGYPAPGTDARLVVCWQRISSGGAGSWGRTDEAFQKVFANFPPKIAVWISPDAMLENVRFDDLHRGGVVTESPETFRKWKNIAFGDGCLSNDPNELVRGYKAELEEMGGGHPMSTLEPKEKYTTP
jgi:hypothetical protein